MPFVPTDLASCQEWFDVTLSPRYQEDTRTTPANATLDFVGGLDDLGTTGAHLLQTVASGRRPQAILDGVNKYLYFNPAGWLLTSAVNVTRGPFTLVMLVRPHGALGIMFHRGAGLGGPNEEWLTDTTTNSVVIYRSSFVVGPTLPYNLTDNIWRTLAVRYDGTTVSYRINGAAVTLSSAAAALGTGTFAAPITIGAAINISYPVEMDYMGHVGCNAALSDSDVALLEGYYVARFNHYGYTSDTNIVCHGNSWVRGYNARVGGTLLDRTSDNLGLAYGPIANYGSDGQQLSAMVANAAATIDTLIVPGKINILFFVETYNQCAVAGGNTSGEDCYDLHLTYAAARYLAGWDYVVVGTPPLNTDARCNTCSALIRANTAAWDAVVDANANSAAIMPGGDGLHPGNDGYGIWAALLSAKILSLLPTPPAPSSSSFTDGLLHLGPHRRSTFLPYATQSRFD